MKRTLLDYTQSILAQLNADEVNSISDTTESLQVAEFIRTAYYNILGRAELPEHDKLFQLTGSADVTRPTLMFRPSEGVAKLNYVWYYNTSVIGFQQGEEQIDHDLDLDLAEDEESGANAGPAYQEVQILPVSDFLMMVNSFDSTASNVGSYTFIDDLTPSETPDNIQHILYRNDKQPQFCCVIQNYYFLFDSFDNTQDSTLQTSKTLCSGFITPNWQAVDTFIPDIDDWAVPLLYNEALALASWNLRNQSHPHAEREIDRQWVSLQKTKAVVNKPSWFDQLPNFGRRKWWP